MANLDSGDAASDLPAPLTPGDHLAMAHVHAVAAHVHAGDAAAHLAAAMPDPEPAPDAAEAATDDVAQDGPGSGEGDRAMMPLGSSQSRSFQFRGGAAHALRQATGGRRG